MRSGSSVGRGAALAICALIAAAVAAGAASQAARARALARCASGVRIGWVGPHVVILDRGVPLHEPRHRESTIVLRPGEVVMVHEGGRFVLTLSGNRYRVSHGQIALACVRMLTGDATRYSAARLLAVRLLSGGATVRAGAAHPQAAAVLSPSLVASADARGTVFTVFADPRTGASDARTANEPITVAAAHDMAVRITDQVGDTAISDREGLRLDVWPFSISPQQRPVRGLPAYWADGSACAVGCAAGASGWPLKPFHGPHALQAGYTDFRRSGFHVGIDIEAYSGEPVYSITSGDVTAIRYPTSTDVNVDIGRFDYWHVAPSVRVGERVTAFRTVIGHVLWGQGHIAFSEGAPGSYLNPLRPGGSLIPFSDTIAPVIGEPRIYAGGEATVAVFDPQSTVESNTYLTPVITPAAVAWQLQDAAGRAVTGLHWALRGSHWVWPAGVPVAYAPGAYAPGWDCYAFYRICRPNFDYRLAGGFTEELPIASLPAGRYRLTVYAWNYAGVTSARDDWITLPLRGLRPAPSGGPLYGQCPAAGACEDRWFHGSTARIRELSVLP